MARKHHNDKTQSVMAWMASERLYEEYLFFYGVILCFWAGVGFFAFGFELPGRSQPENLFYNFLLFLLLATAMALTPMWYRLIFGTQARLERRSREIWEQVEAIADDGKREAIKAHLANDGALPPRYLQKWCLIGLAWFALFELFFVSAWVKDMQLIWQPEWVHAVIAWVRENTTLPPLYVDRKLFTLMLDTDGFLATMFANEKDFLNSHIGETVMLFRAWRTLVFLPSLIFTYIIINKPLDWAGLNYFRNFRTEGYWDHDRFSKFLLFSFFLIPVFLFAASDGLLRDLEYIAILSFGKDGWLSGAYINWTFILIIISFNFFIGWIILFKDVLVFIYRRFSR